MQAHVQVVTMAFLSAGPGAYETGGTSNSLWLCIRRLSGLQTLDLKLLSYAGDKEVNAQPAAFYNPGTSQAL